MDGYNVVSLFDGMGSGAISLTELGMPIDNYYASETDKYAIKQSSHNFSFIKHLGCVTKWREWDIDWATIDLILAGSPCQGFTRIGNRLSFDDSRSVLFFVFADILEYVQSLNPNVLFLLENVNMPKKDMMVISNRLNIMPVKINSDLVSAQSRIRLYWTDVKVRMDIFGFRYTDVPQPKDRNIMLTDILE